MSETGAQSPTVASLPFVELPPLPSADLDEAADPRLNLRDISKAYHAQVRDEMAKLHAAGADGSTVVSLYTRQIDHLVSYLFDAATRLYARRYTQLKQRCAVFALGGYGRGELNLYSDIDLLFLHPWKITPYVETVYETIFYSLMDAGFDVGHAVRNVPICIRMANQDLTVKTSLLDNRYLCGDQTLRQEFVAAMEREIVGKHADRFFQDKAQESEERHLKYGGAIYILEPHLKEGVGGLRDLHTAGWLAKVKYKVKELRELIAKGVVSASLLAAVTDARDFLWKVRNGLHILARAEHDLLTFEYQDQLAPSYGFADVTSFMRCYYGHATVIADFADSMFERCRETPRFSSFLGRARGRTIRDGVRIVDDALVVTKAGIFTQEPVNIVTIFHDAQRHGVSVGESTRLLLRDTLAQAAPELAASPEMREAFFAILKWKQRVAPTLREMHEVGVLEWLLPEFRRLRWRTQRDLYHVFTVDEHTLHGVAAMERLRDGDHKAEMPLLTQVMREIDGVEILFLSMLFHDVGKGFGQEHSERGARMVDSAAARWGLSPDATREWYLLVLHHLFMSHIAQRRDLSDDAVIANFAKTVGSPALLKKLFILTFADMKAVGPKVWNAWKGGLLDELYRRTLERFETGESPEEEREARVLRCKERLMPALASVGAAEHIAAFLDAMPDTYFLSTPEESVPGHFQLVNRFRHSQSDGESEPYRAAVTHFPEREFSEVTIVTQDRPGLFAMLTGVLATNTLNVVSARISTSRDGVALDVFRVSHLDRLDVVMDQDTWTRVYMRLGAVLRGERTMEEMLRGVRTPSLLTRRDSRIPTEVTVDNDSSPDYTLVDVTAPDRMGFLFSVTYALFQLQLQIHLAKITTNVDQVLDVFYVTERDGKKVRDPHALAAALQERLTDGESGGR
jgi:[protein-PII] uridylyltransferase